MLPDRIDQTGLNTTGSFARIATLNAAIEVFRALLAITRPTIAATFTLFLERGYFTKYKVVPAAVGTQGREITAVRALRDVWESRMRALVEERRPLLGGINQAQNVQVDNRTGSNLSGGNPPPSTGTPITRKDGNQRIQNVGMVTEAYFSPLASFSNTFNLQTNNRPRVIQQAEQLWETSAGNKGIIQSFVPRDNLSSYNFNASLPRDVKTNTQERYGFQFHYNPGSIDMTYAGIPDIDVGYVGSGEDVFNLVGSQVSQASITFQLILNRVFDMQYYTPAGRLRFDSPQSLYSPQTPTFKDQEQIYNRGTMYDVEFLLSSILGFRAGTQFRGNTADLGWIGGHPVELFLGRSLKYLAMTQGASLRHIIFNERMVPTFTTLSLTFNRIPDYANSGDSGATGVTTRDPASPAPPSSQPASSPRTGRGGQYVV
jgi:hypothetical protein